MNIDSLSYKGLCAVFALIEEFDYPLEELIKTFRFIKKFGYSKEITELKKRIKEETRIARLMILITKTIDLESVQKICLMRIELNDLYLDWAKLS